MARIDRVPAHFVAQEREQEIYQSWLDQDAFGADASSDKEPFCIVMPPPNITGNLHIGHALDLGLQDMLIRQKRMQGFETLYLPGTDHASIATEVKIVDAMRQEGLTKEDLGREKFLERAWAWKEQYGGHIVEQSKRLGLSCDWSRQRFTLDEGLSKAVTKVFVDMYKEGLIYRGERLINWCPDCLTSISDAEVEHEEEHGSFWHIRYPLSDGSAYLEIATTRPETMLGDTALAVHPEDERYQKYVGKTVILPLVNREIPVVADVYVERDFGTGVVKITPAHDPNDFEVGKRHNLPIINVMEDDGRINGEGGKYAGLSREEARKAIVQDLQEQGFLVKTEDMVHQVGHCYRCHTIVEPRLSKQWFVAMEELAKPALAAVKEGDIEFVPERFNKVYYNWMENVRDWNISRQLWWGHRIPAWYCQACGEITVSDHTPEVCEHCGSSQLVQDPDTLDTWFSSALWPFSTLGWPDQTPDLAKFFPTDVLVTGYDIIFFWVARMIFSSLHQTGQIPFKRVSFHGLVRDDQGRKMSKSLGNGIDPLEMIDLYGADALRFTLVNGASPGNDQRFSKEKIEAARNFSNKVWNAFRFAVLNFDEEMDFSDITLEDLEREDRWIMHEAQALLRNVNMNFAKFELGNAVGNIYAFLWDDFCDWYIEMVKPRLRQEGKSRRVAQYVLNYVLVLGVKLLHPFMPYFTEDIYQHLIHEPGQLIRASWPQEDQSLDFPEEASEISILREAVRSIRNIRADKQVSPKKALNIMVVAESPQVRQIFADNPAILAHLANIDQVTTFADDSQLPLNAVSAPFGPGTVYLALEDLVDLAEEAAKLEGEITRLEGEISRGEKMLANENFTSKAPAAVVDKEKNKLQAYRDALAASRQRLEQIKQS
ncbi:MAG: valine--tRNA ligase [Eubacteriales bacterium]|nr:valine--tRNA ligase [Eubacteriales bacterium]